MKFNSAQKKTIIDLDRLALGLAKPLLVVVTFLNSLVFARASKRTNGSIYFHRVIRQRNLVMKFQNKPSTGIGIFLLPSSGHLFRFVFNIMTSYPSVIARSTNGICVPFAKPSLTVTLKTAGTHAIQRTTGVWVFCLNINCDLKKRCHSTQSEDARYPRFKLAMVYTWMKFCHSNK